MTLSAHQQLQATLEAITSQTSLPSWPQLASTFPWYATAQLAAAYNTPATGQPGVFAQRALLFTNNAFTLSQMLYPPVNDTETWVQNTIARLANDEAAATPMPISQQEPAAQAVTEVLVAHIEAEDNWPVAEDIETDDQHPAIAAPEAGAAPVPADIPTTQVEEPATATEEPPAEGITPSPPAENPDTKANVPEDKAAMEEPPTTNPFAEHEAATHSQPPQPADEPVGHKSQAVEADEEQLPSPNLQHEALAEAVAEQPEAIEQATKAVPLPETGAPATTDVQSTSQVQTGPSIATATPAPAAEMPAPQAAAAATDAAADALLFEPYHTVDYFASQGIAVPADIESATRGGAEQKPLDKKVQSFTQWLKQMKKLNYEPAINKPSDPAVDAQAIKSLQKDSIITEAMAQVLLKQGKKEQAGHVYTKLMLLHPEKSAYFAARLQELKQN